MIRLLIVDDSALMRKLLSGLICAVVVATTVGPSRAGSSRAAFARMAWMRRARLGCVA